MIIDDYRWMNIDIQNPPNLCFSVFGPPYSNPNCGNAPKKGRSDTFTSRLLLDGISIFEFQWYVPATRLLWKWVGVVFLMLLVILTYWYYYNTTTSSSTGQYIEGDPERPEYAYRYSWIGCQHVWHVWEVSSFFSSRIFPMIIAIS